MKGLTFIAELLQHPYRRFSAVELSSLADSLPAAFSEGPARLSGDLVASGMRVERGLGDAGEAIDDETKRSLRKELAHLGRQISQAEKEGDHKALETLVRNRDAIQQYLSGAVGLHGRTRRNASQKERVRTRVTNRVTAALRRVGQELPELAVFLENSIETGGTLVYRPHEPIPWSF